MSTVPFACVAVTKTTLSKSGVKPGQIASFRARTLDANGFTVEEIKDVTQLKWASYIPPTARVRSLLAGRLDNHLGADAGREDAVRLVRFLTANSVEHHSSDVERRTPTLGTGTGRAPLGRLPIKTRRSALALVASGSLHVALLLALLFLTSLGWLRASETEQPIKDTAPVRLVFLMTPGPGGGGGGSGMKVPVKKVSVPAPPVRRTPPPPRPVMVDPPRPVEPPRIDPPKIEPPKVDPPVVPPAQTVQAPIIPAPADQNTRPGVLNQAPVALVGAGPGRNGGAGTGSGGGIGEGQGAGIGPGSGGGVGGGPLRPGSGIEPPTLVKEVKPTYTDQARRRSIEGDVLLEIVVRRYGSVGGLRVLRSLGAGLDEKAAEAVRQWRIGPATRQGVPVDVVVEVSVEFSLR